MKRSTVNGGGSCINGPCHLVHGKPIAHRDKEYNQQNHTNCHDAMLKLKMRTGTFSGDILPRNGNNENKWNRRKNKSEQRNVGGILILLQRSTHSSNVQFF